MNREKLNMDLSRIMSLDDMKEIMSKSIKNAETWGDFYAGIIIGVYELGLEHGKPEQKKGKWIHIGCGLFRCDQCDNKVDFLNVYTGESAADRFHFCPHCGADMRGE